MGSAFHQLCLRYSGTLTPTAPTAIRLWETFTFYSAEHEILNAHKYENIKKFSIFQAQICLECYFSLSLMLKCHQLLAF